MRIVFFGSGAFGLPTLARLAERHRIVGVVSQPDRPAGRGGKPTQTPIAAWAAEHLPGVPMRKPERVGEPEEIRAIHELAAKGQDDTDLAFVVIAFGQKMPPGLLDGIFAINLHASLLPRWRGAAPINAAILAGDEVTGNSVITLADRMDAGLVLGQSTRPITPSLTAGELHDLLAEDGPRLVEDVLERHRAGTLSPVVQDESLVTKAGKLRKEHGWIDFGETAEACRRRIHGLNPWPGVTIRFRDEELKVLRAGATPATDRGAPGTITDPRVGLAACADSTALQLIEVQPSGGKPMAWAAFANGRRVRAGEVLMGRDEGDGGDTGVAP
jgi:methionyl-tRNA formyltransferase